MGIVISQKLDSFDLTGYTITRVKIVRDQDIDGLELHLRVRKGKVVKDLIVNVSYAYAHLVTRLGSDPDVRLFFEPDKVYEVDNKTSGHKLILEL